MKHTIHRVKHKKRNLFYVPSFLPRDKGFTLIELLVAIAVFMIVISIIVSLFMMSLKGHRKTIAIQNVQDNAKYLLEFMAKEIRMSEVNNATSTTLNITRPDGEAVSYFFNNEQGRLERTDSSTSGPINSSQVSVTGNFYTLGIGKNDDQQPRVTIKMKVETGGAKAEERAKINIQTTVSQRNLDL